jgi:glycosyltransferase involved in cell wall biosynthesis
MDKTIDKLDISAVIPVYNAEKTINICFHSVYDDLRDSGYSFEIILINDGSSDNSFACLENIKAEYNSCVVLINQKNLGPSSARNTGLKYAKGQYISFCDSDDMWLPGKTSKTMEILMHYNDIKCLGGRYIDKSGVVRYTAQRLRYIRLTDQLFKNHFNTPTITISRDIVDNGLFFDEKRRYSEDSEYFNRVIKQFPAVLVNELFTRSVTNKYIYGESGLSGNLWAMEKGELNNIYRAYRTLQVNWFICICAFIFSLMKYLRRIVISLIRKN